MKAIILCGGMGTRLREYTEVRPKPMVEIGGRPILWHIMKIYAHYHITDFILCLGYKANVIKEYFLNYEAMNLDFTIKLGQPDTLRYHHAGHSESGWTVTLAYTGENAGTGARIKRAVPYLGKNPDTFAVTYGDGVTDANLSEILRFHRAHGKLVTITGVRPPSRFGDLQVKGTRVTGFAEKTQGGQGLISGGFFFLEPRFLDYLSEDEGCFLEQTPLEQCAKEGQLHVFNHPGFWQCMDTYRDWELLERQWQSGHAPWKIWK